MAAENQLLLNKLIISGQHDLLLEYIENSTKDEELQSALIIMFECFILEDDEDYLLYYKCMKSIAKKLADNGEVEVPSSLEIAMLKVQNKAQKKIIERLRTEFIAVKASIAKILKIHTE